MTQPRILVVDDDVGLALLLKLNLEQTEEFVVMVVNSAKVALRRAEQFQPDLMLLDVMMPDLDGGELAAQLRAKPTLKDVPIVFLTAAVKKNEISSRGGQIGGYPFLAKPVDVPQVIACIRSHLRTPPAS